MNWKQHIILTAPVLLAILISVVEASITILDSGKKYASRPDKKLGHQLWQGSDYLGRLQYVHGNMQLCKSAEDPSQTFSITRTLDGLPVAIYAKSGGCSLEEKAYVASRLLSPPNMVGYLIVEDSGRARRTKKRSTMRSIMGSDTEDDESFDDSIENQLWSENVSDTDEDLSLLWDELMAQVHKQPAVPFEAKTLPPLHLDSSDDDTSHTVIVEKIAGDDDTSDPYSDEGMDSLLTLWSLDDASDETVNDSNLVEDDFSISSQLERFRLDMDENAWWKGGDELQNEHLASRRLKHYRANDVIAVAILHVSNHIGFELLDLLLKENSEVGRLGGPKVVLNSKGPGASAGTVFVWTMLTVAACSCTCCCLMICFEFSGQDERNAPRQPVRRRLTNDQVREKFPAFRYHPENHIENPLEDECAICLDDFAEGMRLRKLPCGHVFHSTCVARWLVERSAVCPLCKMDLYEEEEDDEDETAQARTDSLRERYGAMASLTNIFSRPQRNQTVGTTSPPPAGQPAVVPPAQAFRWGSGTTPNQAEGQEGGTTSTMSPLASMWQSSRRWLSRRRRQGTEANGMLTELTEPLMSNAGYETAQLPEEAETTRGDPSSHSEPRPNATDESAASSPVEV